ncbi:MAG: hypothetical protein E3J94_03660 [Desulfobacteraceae bacterium]|nr:MAG: hypothetical protein E3J94_03660 [Desulfobacteraceae bacterium]
MALIKYGGGIVQMSGSIAGTTHARNRYGNYARARTKPVNPKSTNQVLVRSIMAELTTRWSQTLSAAQRTAWNLYGSSVPMKNKLGEVIRLTGFNHYIRSNHWFSRMGRTLVDDGPIIFELPAMDPTMSCTGSEGTQLVTMTFDDTHAWCSEDDAMLVILQGDPQNPQRNFFNGPWRGRSAKVGDAGVPVTSPLDYASITVISELQRVWVKFRILRADGRLSEDFTANFFCAA